MFAEIKVERKGSGRKQQMAGILFHSVLALIMCKNQFMKNAMNSEKLHKKNRQSLKNHSHEAAFIERKG